MPKPLEISSKLITVFWASTNLAPNIQNRSMRVELSVSSTDFISMNNDLSIVAGTVQFFHKKVACYI